MGAPKKRPYKRSWKNYLLDAKYQLRFTLFMVGVAAALISVLGYWVQEVAAHATLTAINNVHGVECQSPVADGVAPDRRVLQPDDTVEPSDAVEPVDGEAAPSPEQIIEGEPDDSVGGDDGQSAEATTGEQPPTEGAPRERAKPTVVIEHNTMTVAEEPAVDPAGQVRFYLCKLSRRSTIDALRHGEKTIRLSIVLAGIALCLYLGLYGIKMTHRVAGPLFKVGLYLDKMKNGKYDTVYDLRKGDELVEFYEHFKDAHAGLAKVAQEDREMLEKVIKAVDNANVSSTSPELEAAIAELRAIVERKEKANG